MGLVGVLIPFLYTSPQFYLLKSVANDCLEGEVAWGSYTDRAMWEEEQVRLDREWYALDEGADQANNPFSNVSEEYARKKEQQLEQRKKKRMSAQQRQINKVIQSDV